MHIAIFILIIGISFIPWILLAIFFVRTINKQFKNEEEILYKSAKERNTTFNLLNYNFYNTCSWIKPSYLEASCKIWKVFFYKEFATYRKIIRTIDYTIQFFWSRYNIHNKIVIIENHTSVIKAFSQLIYRIHRGIFLSIFFLVWLMFTIFSVFIQYIILPIIIILIINSLLFGKYWILWKLYNTIKQQSMESLWFEKSFDAFSQDPIEARMIITPAFMDRLEQFSDKWDLKWKIRIIWEKDTFTLLLKWDIEKYGKESDGSYTLIKSMEEMLNLSYYSINTNNQ